MLYLNYVRQIFAGLGSDLSALLGNVFPIPPCPLNTTFLCATPYTYIYWFYQVTVAAQDSGSKMIINT